MASQFPFKSMSRETKLDHHKPKGAGEVCERCKVTVFPGDWPWCRDGHPEDHLR